MCDCIEEMEEKLMSYATENGLFKKPIKSVTMKGKAFSLGGGSLGEVVTHEFEFELEGQKKKPTVGVTHQYCPFCGDRKIA